MADLRTPKLQPVPGVRYWELGAAHDGDAILCGDASGSTIGTFIVQVEGNSWTGDLTVEGRLLGAGHPDVGMGWQGLAYQNLTTNEDITDGSPIDADGVYAIRADIRTEVRLVYGHGGTSVKVLVSGGKG